MKKRNEEKWEEMKSNLEVAGLIAIFGLSLYGVSPAMSADEIVHKFKNPSFSGVFLIKLSSLSLSVTS